MIGIIISGISDHLGLLRVDSPLLKYFNLYLYLILRSVLILMGKYIFLRSFIVRSLPPPHVVNTLHNYT